MITRKTPDKQIQHFYSTSFKIFDRNWYVERVWPPCYMMWNDAEPDVEWCSSKFGCHQTFVGQQQPIMICYNIPRDKQA